MHLWLGLISGLVVFIIAITGCLYAFQEEIQNATQEYRFVKEEKADFLLPTQLEKIAHTALPNRQLHSIKYNTKEQAAEAIFFHYQPTYYYIIYLNPYNGKVLQVQNMDDGFFRWVLNGHFYLWLPPSIGQPVVAVFTLIFLVMLITGIILWYPKNKNALKQRLWFRWKNTTTTKRKNYDLHSIIGFYTSLFALVFVITGLVWGFQWWAKGWHKILGGKISLQYKEMVSSKNSNEKITNPTDVIYLKIKSETPDAKSIEVHPPETDSSSITVNTNTEIGTYWKIDYRYFDQYSLKELKVDNIYGRFDKPIFADKIMRMNYDIHTGAVLGLPGKIFAFLISLLIASLPVTGVMIWLKRKKKSSVTKAG